MASLRVKLLITIGLVAVLGTVAFLFPIVPILSQLCSWVGGLGLPGLFLISLLLALGSLFFLPATPFVLAAAAVFGFPLGLLGSVVGIALGATVGFFLSRWFLRKEVANEFRKHPTFRAIDLAIEKEGWKMVALLRLCPIPFGLANYLYGLTAVRFLPYLLMSVAGSFPAVLLFSHLGSAGKAELEVILSGHLGHSSGEMVLLGVSLVATLCVLFFLPRFARRAVAKYANVSIPS